MAKKKEWTLSDSKRKRVRKVLDSYSGKSSVSGVPFIVSTSYPLIRWVWTLLLAVGVTAMSIHLGYLLAQYFSYPTQSVIELNFSILTLPAITICNANPFQRSKLNLTSPALRELASSFKGSELRSMLNLITTTRRNLKLPGQKGDSIPPDYLVPPPSPPLAVSSPNATGTSYNTTDEISPTEITPENDNSTSAAKSTVAPQTTTPESTIADHGSVTTEDPNRYSGDFAQGVALALGNQFDVDSWLNNGWASSRETLAAGSSPSEKKTLINNKKEAMEYLRKLNDVYKILYNGETPQVRRQIGHQLKDMMVHCQFSGRPCKPSYFKHSFSNIYGNCYTVEHEEMLVDNDGSSSGLELTLYLQTTDYIAGFSPTKGAQVVVHEPGTVAFPADEGFAVTPGHHTLVGLKMQDIERLGEPYGDCSDVDDFKEKYGILYTRQACQKICQAKYVLEQCGCFDVYGDSVADLLKQTERAMPCRSSRERACSSRAERELYRNQKVLCRCSNPCREKKYKKTISSKIWPAEEYGKAFLSLVCAEKDTGMDCDEMLAMEDNRLREEFVTLSIYYEDLNYEFLQEVPDYKLVQLISDIGGTIGLWIGLSVLSLFEIVHLFVGLLVAVCCPVLKQGVYKERRGEHQDGHPDENIPLS